MPSTPPFLKHEARHVQVSASVLFYAEVTAFLLSFFDTGFCRDFLLSHPDFLEVFEIMEDDNGKELVVLKEALGVDSQIDAKFADLLLNYDLPVNIFDNNITCWFN